MLTLAQSALRLDASPLDYAILAIYFAAVLGIGAVARLSIKTDVDFFLSGRSLPAWITALAFVAANLGALEILGMGLPREDAEPERMFGAERVWYRSPWLLGAGAMVLIVVLNIIFI